MPKKKSYITLTDQFCGAGGSTIGAVRAGLTITQAMNHWRRACETYAANHHVDPDCADVSATSPKRYASTDVLITSPECTNHSLAKGKPRVFYTEDLFGQKLIDPSEERSRATMWDVPRFAEYHDYNLILAENVVDAAKWRMWDSWLHAMHSLDYEHEVVYLNSMFCWPTPQSRDRLYVVFWKKGNKKPDLEIRPKAFCESCAADVEAIQTWKKRTKWGRYKRQYFYRCPKCHKEITPYYYAGINALDLTIPTTRIGDRDKPLKPKTIERIRYGLNIYKERLMLINGRHTSGISYRVKNAFEDPVGTQTADVNHGIVMPWLIETAHTKGNGKYVAYGTEPMYTQTSAQTIALVQGFLSKQYGSKDRNGVEKPNRGNYAGLDEPMGSVTTYDHHALIQTDAFLSYYYGGMQASGMMDAIGTISTRERHVLIQNAMKLSIDDLYFRMLTPPEIGGAMAFPKTYKVLGTIKEQVKQYGNAVTPPAMDLLVQRGIQSLL